MGHARYCDLGTYQILVPDDPRSETVLLLRRKAPFVLFEDGYGLNIFQKYSQERLVPFLTIQPDSTGSLRRLDYLVIDGNGHTVANVRDLEMSGDTIVTKYAPPSNNAWSGRDDK